MRNGYISRRCNSFESSSLKYEHSIIAFAWCVAIYELILAVRLSFFMRNLCCGVVAGWKCIPTKARSIAIEVAN